MVDFQSDSNFDEEDSTEGLEDLSLSEDVSDDENVGNENEGEIPEEGNEGSTNEVVSDDENVGNENEAEIAGEGNEGRSNDGAGGSQFDESTAVNCLEDISSINFKELSSVDMMRYHFSDVGVAFTFYNWYASYHGFAARKSKVMRKKSGELTQQTFVCYRQGYTEEKSRSTTRKRVRKARVRCGCEAKCRVHIEANTGRWYMKLMHDAHNHSLLDDQFTAMLPAHRKMSEFDIWRMRNMRQVGIKTTHIFGLFANEAGGYGKVGFRKRDMYNEQERLRLTSSVDAKAACKFLESMRASDETMFWKHRVDNKGRLSHLFWCDGAAQRDFVIFGDVVAFDATYKRNKYMCPLVVFSGVNNHNQSIVFCGAIVCDETEETYVWLLEQFLSAMGGKSPASVITDGDLAMKNAIRRVFPKAHHRLCAWHLIRNACTNVGNNQFVQKFKQCMLGDYDVGQFKRKWDKMVDDFGLKDNKWVRDMYEKRDMWATAHIRGKFFAGFRTTSRCEGLHAQFGRYVNYQNNLLEFLHQFFRCLSYMRFSEVEADFESVHGAPVLETPLPLIERVAGKVYTREVFLLLQPVFRRACTCNVVACMQTTSCYFYTVNKYPKHHLQWQVSFSPTSLVFKCSCQRFESLGIVCEHLVAVLVYLNIVTLPESLVLKRWTKNAKDSIDARIPRNNISSQPVLISQYTNMVERCKRMSVAAVKCGKPELMRTTIELIDAQTKVLESACSGNGSSYVHNRSNFEETLQNPIRARTKGCGVPTSSTKPKVNHAGKKTQACGVCRVEGHNRKSCPINSQLPFDEETQIEESNTSEDDYGDDSQQYGNVGNIDMNSN